MKPNKALKAQSARAACWDINTQAAPPLSPARLRPIFGR